MGKATEPPKRSVARAARAQTVFGRLRRDRALLQHVPPELLSSRLVNALPVHSVQFPLARSIRMSHVAPRTGWLYFLRYKSHTAALEVSSAGQHRYARLHQGGAVELLLRRLRNVKRHLGALKDAHIRLLQVNTLHLSCLWLHGKSNNFIPISSLDPNLAEGVLYSQSVFMSRIADAASAVLPLHAKVVRSRRPRRL
jgi:hypothetical protein